MKTDRRLSRRNERSMDEYLEVVWFIFDLTEEDLNNIE